MDLNTIFAPQVEKLRQIYRELGYEPDRLQEALQTAIDSEVERSAQELSEVKQRISLLTQQCRSYRVILDDAKSSSSNNDTDSNEAAPPLSSSSSSSTPTKSLLNTLSGLQVDLDRLQSIYASRRAQAEKLIARIDDYRPILGEEAPVVTLEYPDPESTVVPSLPRPSELHALLSSCAEEVRRRNTQIEENLTTIVQLWSDLWLLPDMDDEFDAMILRHLDLQPVLTEYDNENDETGGRVEFAGVFEQASSVHQADDFNTAAAAAASATRLEEQTPTRKSGSERELGTQVSRVQRKNAVAPTLDNIAQTSAKVAALSAEKESRFAKIQDVYDDLSLLWKRFDVGDEAIDEFVQENTGCNMAVIQAYERELKQMKELKGEHMTLFISKVREDIAALWDQLLMTEEERRDSLPEFFEDLLDGEEGAGAEPSDELLALHEQKVEVLKEDMKAKARPLDLVRQYKKLLAEADDLEASAKDTSRLTGRGVGQKRDPGRLLREEKMRKRIKVMKPKIEEELLRTIPAWEEESGRAFCINGERFLDSINVQPASPKKRARVASGNSGSASVAATPQTAHKKSRLDNGAAPAPAPAPGTAASVRRVMTTPYATNANTPAPPPQSTLPNKESNIPRPGGMAKLASYKPTPIEHRGGAYGMGAALQAIETNRITSHSSNGSAASHATDRTTIIHSKPVNKLKRRGPSLLVEESLRSSGLKRSEFSKPCTTGAGATVRPISSSTTMNLHHGRPMAYNESMSLCGPNWAVLDENEESHLLS